MKLTELNAVFLVLRKQQGFKQSEVASKTGISQAVISRIEEGSVGVDGKRWETLFSSIGYQVKVKLEALKK